MDSKPQLFLLKPGYGEARNQFCPDCALVEGFFVYQPALKALVDFHYIEFTRPRMALVTLLGEALQNSPALVFPEGVYPDDVAVSETGRAYLNDGRAICTWLGRLANGLIPS